MKQTISVQIDVNKIDKKRLYKGQKGVYLNGVIFLNDEPDQYGNHGFICESVSKEEREAGTRGEILGNVKILNRQGSLDSSDRANNARTEKPSSSAVPDNFDDMDDDLPFSWLLMIGGAGLMQVIMNSGLA